MGSKGMATAKQHFGAIDLLKIIAIFGIVGCHLNLPNMTEGALFLKRFTDFNVCVFAALSGFFFFCGSGSLPEFLHKRSKRLLAPYFIWSIIYVTISTALHFAQTGHIDTELLTVQRWLSILFWGNSSCHLWFIISLFYAQCILCPMRNLKVSKYIWLVLAIGVVALATVGGNWYYYYPVRLLGFVMLGGWLAPIADESAQISRVRSLFLIGWLVVGIALIAFCDDYLYLREVIITLPLCELAIRAKGGWLEKHSRILSLLGAMTFTVYLVHPIITAALQMAIVRLFSVQGVLVFAVDQVMAFVLSFGFAWCAYKVRYLLDIRREH